MGILDNKITTNYVDGIIDIEAVHKILEEKIGNKYKVKFVKKGNLAKQFLGAQNYDQIHIIKNAYHRTYISLNHLNKQLGIEKDETHFQFNTEDCAAWMSFLNRNFGLVGAGIIRLIYGSGKPFNNDILEALKASYEVKSREENYGISKLWKKDEPAN